MFGGVYFAETYFAESTPVQVSAPTVTLAPYVVHQPRRTRSMPRVHRLPMVVVPEQDDASLAKLVQPRRRVMVQQRRGHTFAIVPPQIVPPSPYPWNTIVQPRRVRGLMRRAARRGRRYDTVPPQLNPPYPWNELKQPRQPRGLTRQRRGRQYVVVPEQDDASLAMPVRQPRRQRGFTKLRRGKSYEVVPPQFNPPYPWNLLVPVRRLRNLAVRRSKLNQYVPDQQPAVPNPPITFTVQQVRRLRGLARQRRTRSFETVPPQLNPPYPWSELVSWRRLRTVRLRRGKSYEVTPGQIIPPVTPFNPPNVQQAKRRWMLQRRSRLQPVVPAQPTPVLTARARRPFARIRRGTVGQPPFPSRRGRLRLRRGRTAAPVMPQAYGPNPPIVLPPRQPRRLRGFFRWRKRLNQPVPPQVGTPPTPETFKPGPLDF
jgi:hypothetical protein